MMHMTSKRPGYYTTVLEFRKPNKVKSIGGRVLIFLFW